MSGANPTMMNDRTFFGLGRLGTLLLASLVSGCGIMPWIGADRDPTPPTKLVQIVPSASLTPIWSQRVTRGTQGRELDLVPAVVAERIYVADARGRLVALDAGSGRVLWERETGLSFSGGPDVRGDRLVLGTSRGEVVALSTGDGAELWRTQVGSEVLSVPRLTDQDQVIARTLEDSIYGIDATSGEQQWRVHYPAPVLTLRGSSRPVETPFGILVGLSGGKLLNLDPEDGTPLWEVAITRPSGRSELARIADIDADPVVIGTIAFVGSYNGDLAAVDISSGSVLWRRELSAHAGLAANETALFVTDSTDQIWRADPSDGAGRWRQEALLYRRVTAPELVGNLVVVGDFEGYLHLLSQADGRLVGRTRLTSRGAITARPLSVGGRLIVYADDGTLAAFSVGSAADPTERGDSPASLDAGAAATQAPDIMQDTALTEPAETTP